MYFMPYDFVWERIDVHVADIERTILRFVGGEPSTVTAPYHSWRHTVDYRDKKLEKYG